MGILLRDTVDTAQVAGIGTLDWYGYLHNVVPVILGNIVGGSGLVALVYYVIYRRSPESPPKARRSSVRVAARARTDSAG
jgi:formate/nitrite transporter FocA (FNT family)